MGITPESIRQAIQDLHAMGHGRANRARAWLEHHFGPGYQTALARQFHEYSDEYPAPGPHGGRA